VKKFLFMLLLTPWLMGAGGGCETTTPTNYQIELNIPDSVLTCVEAKSIHNPGAKATKAQTSVYIVKLYHALDDCNGNNATVRKLYKNWKAKVEKVNG
jgi:hypothetical protein